jgi:hypothetical protein
MMKLKRIIILGELDHSTQIMIVITTSLVPFLEPEPEPDKDQPGYTLLHYAYLLSSVPILPWFKPKAHIKMG